MNKHANRVLPWAAGAASLLLVLSGCADTSSEEAGAEEASSQGFEFGASQDVVDAAIADLEPVTLTYQSNSRSPDAVSSLPANAFLEEVEERSGGKISFEVIWGLGVAGNSEIEDALQDGRLDIAFAAPNYEPTAHPMVNAINELTPYGIQSPMIGEMASLAALTEFSWSNDELISEYTDVGLTPLAPLVSIGEFHFLCTEPIEDPSDWNGKQVRVSGSSHIPVVEGLGASPVSIEFPEIYEALQRGTVDCAISFLQTASAAGFTDVAPYIYHLPDTRMSGAGTGAHLAGSSFTDLPLAYQQIIFDAENAYFPASIQAILEASADVTQSVEEVGGEAVELDQESAQIVDARHDQLVENSIEQGVFDSDIREQMSSLASNWSAVAEELGYEDSGNFNELHNWYDSDDTDFQPFADRVFEETALSHRPE